MPWRGRATNATVTAMSPSIPQMPVLAPGWVWLVGAGPGDPGLFTLAGYSAMQQADVIVHDALVDERVLAFAPTGAALEPAGKRGGRPSSKQLDISRRLVQWSRAGKRVVRLKGGDPFVFGRGGEEALTLVENDVPFRVVPGVTAGVGAPAYAGIPTTHRDTNSAVTFLTGHNVAGEVPDGLDWRALANGSPVLVVYMAMKHLAAMTAKLREAGRRAEEPVAVISRATTSEQRVLTTTLSRAADDVDQSALAPPAVIVIGEVVRLRAGLDWLNAMHGGALVSDPLATRGTADTG